MRERHGVEKSHVSVQEQMHVLPSYDDGDQGFLNAYFGQVWALGFSL